jgi:DNA polymerase-3 subunit delta'
LTDGGAHAFLLHGPAGVGKRTAAFAFAAALLGDERRVASRSHPDLYLLEPLGEMIRIDDVRALRHDLHMRPFEGDRRVYLVLDADRMNDEAADALLKDLEEPPSYAVMVLVAGELGPLPPTILSRCQLIPFRRLSEPAVREWIAGEAPELSEDEVRVLARASGGRLDRARRLLDPDAAARRDALIAAARSVYLEPEFDPNAAAAVLLGLAGERGEEAREREQALVDTLDLTTRDAEQRVRRAQRGAERDELLAALEGLEAWYRDLVVVAAGAEDSAIHADRLDDLREDVEGRVSDGAIESAEAVREAWLALDEFNLNPALALEALFVRLQRGFRGVHAWS